VVFAEPANAQLAHGISHWPVLHTTSTAQIHGQMHTCDRQTDGRTDRQTDGQNYDSQHHSSIAASCGKNKYWKYFCNVWYRDINFSSQMITLRINRWVVNKDK